MRKYDTSWNLVESRKGNLPIDGDSYEKKYEEWKNRSFKGNHLEGRLYFHLGDDSWFKAEKKNEK